MLPPNRGRRLLFIAVVVATTAACANPAPPSAGSALGNGSITVASFNFPESVLLAELYAQAIEGAGLPVERLLDLGPREIVLPALEKGLVELVPEYAGSALTFVSIGDAEATSDPTETEAALRDLLEPVGVVVLAPSPAQDQNAIGVTAATAARYDLRTVSDLAPIASQLVFGGPPECTRRPLCLPGLEVVYGLRFGSFATLDSGGPLTIAALRAGAVDVAVLFSSDGALERNDLVLLDDDLGLQPAENVTPVIRREALERWPQLRRVIDGVSSALTTEHLRQMNAAVAVLGRQPAAVAAEWLADHGLSASG
ncbi:MAG TPA: ABC transporter substrate-binding protein [Actinomycetota bacterium]|nr:ABC transporter substrate-binding protein [Actinomycetota bacterium]